MQKEQEQARNVMKNGVLAVALLLVSFTSASAQLPSNAPAPVYEISVRILAGASRLEIVGQVTLPPFSVAVDTVALRLDSRFEGLEVTVISPSASAGPATVSRSGNLSTVTLAAPTPSGSPLVLTFRHFLDGVQTRSLYVAADGAYISGESFHWYPLPAPHRRAKGRLRFQAPEGFTVAATGQRVSTDSADAGLHEFQVDDLTTFSFAAGRHVVYRSRGNPTIALHLLRERPRANERLDAIRRIVDALVSEFGPFPHPDLEIVEMPARAAGGRNSAVSLEGFIVSGVGPIESVSLPVLAHEISHQWWADSVFATGEGRVLLTEAMAEYGALRATEAIYGDQAAAEFRWRGYPGLSLFAGGRGYLGLVVSNLDVPLTAASFPGSLPVTKGTLVHDLLARTVGRDAFRGFLQDFLREHAFQDTTWREFTEEAVGRFGDDLELFIEQWYEREGVPEWVVSWDQRGGLLRGVITQKLPFYSADIDVVAEGVSERVVQRIRVSGDRTEFAWPVAFMVGSVRLDPDFTVPHQNAERLEEVMIVAPLARALRLMAEGGADFLTAAKAAMDEARDMPQREFVLQALQAGDALDRGDSEAARTHLRTALSSRVRIPEFVPEMYYNEAVLAAAAGDQDLMKESALAAIAADAELIAPTGFGLASLELLP